MSDDIMKETEETSEFSTEEPAKPDSKIILGDEDGKDSDKDEDGKDSDKDEDGKDSDKDEDGKDSDKDKKDDNKPSFADVLYDEITSVIGGNNPNQFFCMVIPGTLIDPSQYTYDVDSNQIKPAHVKANESKLANKLFDAAFMSPGDNGRHLTTQYTTALNMLTPKLNGKLFEAKSKLREVLMTPYPYNFGDGEDTDVLTLEQVFYRLYAEYVEAKEKWAQEQLDKKKELERKYPDGTKDANVKRNDEYLDWYGVVAESKELAVAEKLGTVLGVFSPGDMEIIAGILESGSGRELEEARTALSNVGELNPNGGYTYPVTFYPENWFSLLDHSFTPKDLLESPAALSQQLQVLEMQRNNIMDNINQFLSLVQDTDKVNDLKNKYEECKTAYRDILKNLESDNISASIDMVKTVFDIIANNPDFDKIETDKDVVVNSITNETIGRIFGVTDIGTIGKIIDTLSNNIKQNIKNQNELVSNADATVTAAMEYFESATLLKYKEMLQPLQDQLKEVNEKIEELKSRITLSSNIQDKPETDKDGQFVKPDPSKVAPNKVPDNFTQIIISTSASTIKKESSRNTESSQSSYDVSFIFGGYSSDTSHNAAISKEISENTKTDIQIGMSVAKVEIDREWFNPGVFMLTSDMYNTSSQKIAPPENVTNFHDKEAYKRLDAMNNCIFPCYPTSFVVAKDITIRFTSSEAISDEFAKSIEDHASKGGGFFIFGGSSASASSSSNSSAKATSNANSVTVRITAPQIIGYYLEAVAPDKSTFISDQRNADSDYVSVFRFIDMFKSMLDTHNEKYHKDDLLSGSTTK